MAPGSAPAESLPRQRLWLASFHWVKHQFSGLADRAVPKAPIPSYSASSGGQALLHRPICSIPWFAGKERGFPIRVLERSVQFYTLRTTLFARRRRRTSFGSRMYWPVEHNVIPLDGADAFQNGEIDSIGDRVALTQDPRNRLPDHELSTVNDHSLRFNCSATSADRLYGCTEIFSGVGEDSGTTATVTVWPIRRGIGGLPVILMRTG
jgi:hypothetical protein